MKVQIVKTNFDIELKRGTPGSAGYDVQAAIDQPITLYPGEKKLIPLGFACHIKDPNVAAVLLPRSGLGTKYGINLANTVGLIDSDYQNEWMAPIVNNGKEPYTFEPLDRIGQIVFLPVIHPEFEEVSSFSEETERGLGGFGSTGEKALA